MAAIMRTKEHQETVTMEDGINKFIGRMTHMHEVTLAGNTLLHTGKLEPIDMRVMVRSGGKKVRNDGVDEFIVLIVVVRNLFQVEIG